MLKIAVLVLCVAYAMAASPKRPCPCPRIYRPVCANGQQFDNRCLARCEGFRDYTQGECEDNADCFCAMSYEPVCGADGKTYSNDCARGCARVALAYAGECSNKRAASDCVCLDVYEPVCGDDGVTYSNSCNAACNGVRVLGAGECYSIQI